MSLLLRWIPGLLLLLCAQFASAQGGRSFADAEKSAVPYHRTSTRAQASCAGLAALTGNDYSITSARSSRQPMEFWSTAAFQA